MEWTPNQNAEITGTSLKGYIVASYSDLHKLFGESSCDDYKVSTQWVLTYDDHVVTLYDYKETNLYDDDLPSVEAFRAQPFYEWHIGAHSKIEAEAFKLWLKVKLGDL